MRLPLLLGVLALPLFATPEILSAQTLSAEIGNTGLGATQARLAALAAPTDADRFALGGVRFLAVVEHSLQQRWKIGLTDSMTMLPFLRLPIAENPNPAAFDPAVIGQVFRDASAGMDAARAPLAEIPETSDFTVEISLADLWFDINANTTRDPGEDMLAVAGPMIMGWQWAERDPATPAPVIRFDAADAAWLSAYTHLLAGISDTILAYDPTQPITNTLTSRAALADLAEVRPDPFFGTASNFDAVDMIATILATLNQTPDAARALSAHAHFLAMIADNRTFWARVASESDNDHEWLPNDAQQSALGITVPQGTAAVWLAVLSDAEKLLNGQVLAPYWRLGDGAGVNVGRLFTDPKPIDVAGWIQGADALPYLEKGPLVSAANWWAFEQLMSGEAMLFTLFLN
ncbi:MAG: hypothetical protein WCC57_04345 [Paracoccaceae bacterium]